MRHAFAALVAAVLAVPTLGLAQPEVRTLPAGQAPGQGGIAAVTWMEGRWTAQAMGGQVEETYSGPVDGAMVGHFRLVQGGKPVFYQFIVIREAAGTLAYRLKHFAPDGRPWEDKDRWVEFPLVAVAGDTVFFSGLTLVREGADGMVAHLRLRRPNGESAIETFRFRRAR